MSLTSSLFAGVSGLTAQGQAISALSNNISNMSTVGYKGGNASFSSLVAGGASASGFNSGGVSGANRPLIDQQGLLQATGNSTDIALSGNGMMVVNSSRTGGGEYLYSRAGSFRKDSQGNLRNASGFYLQAWPLDSEARLPGQLGNLNKVASQLLASTESINLNKAQQSAQPSTKVDWGINLKASETPYKGSGKTMVIPAGSTTNFNVASTDILAPNAFSNIVAGDSFSVTAGTVAYTYTYGGFIQGNDITGTIFGATNPTTTFTLTNNDSFSINTAATGTVTFKFKNSNPLADNGEFSNLSNLATSINTVSGLRARVVANRLYVSPTDATQAMTIANVTGPAVATGIFGATLTTVVGANRFSTLDGLQTLIKTSPDINASLGSPSSGATLEIFARNPLDTITFTDTAGGGNILFETGIVSLIGTLTTGVLNPTYDASGAAGSNMASGKISPQFTRRVRVYDQLGTGHDISVSFIKAQNNRWLVEIYAAELTDIVTALPNGQIATGELFYNGDGTLKSVSSGLTKTANIVWSNQSAASTIAFSWGTAGKIKGTPGADVIGQADGMSQFDAPYNVSFASQNGAGAGLLSSINIDKDGFVFANYTNGQSRKIYKIPIADFPNMNGLKERSGNAYAQSDQSGEYNLKEAAASGVGTFVAGSLEGSTTELSKELTDMIVAQRAYQASTKVITTVDKLLEELNRITT